MQIDSDTAVVVFVAGIAVVAGLGLAVDYARFGLALAILAD